MNLKRRTKVGLVISPRWVQVEKESVLTQLSSSGNDKPQRRRQAISRQAIAGLQAGEELCEAVGEDPAHLEVRRDPLNKSLP